MVKRLRVFAALARDQTSVPRTHMGGSQMPVALAPDNLKLPSGLHSHFTHEQHTHTHTLKIK